MAAVSFIKSPNIRQKEPCFVFRDAFCAVNPTAFEELDRFQNVREITGYLDIEEWPGTDLCIFKYDVFFVSATEAAG